MSYELKQPRLNLTLKLLLLFGAIVLIQSSFLLVIFALVEESEKLLEVNRQARLVVAATAKFSADLQSATVSMLNQIQFLNMGNERYQEILSRIPQDTKILKELLKDNPSTKAQMNELESSAYEAQRIAEKMPASARETGSQQKMLHDLYGIQLVDISHSITSSIDELDEKYRLVLQSNGVSLAAQSDNLFYLALILGFLINVVVAVALYYYVISRITNKLGRLAQNMINLSIGEPLLSPLRGNDELADLDANFQTMAKNLQSYRTTEATILEHAANFICSVNSKGVFVSVPAASSALWGYAPNELLGSRFNSIVNSDIFEPTDQLFKLPGDVLENVSFENQVRCRDGTLIDIAWTANLNDHGDIVCIGHNVTDRKRVTDLIRKSDERFRSIVEQMPVAVLDCDQSFTVVASNNAASKMLDADQLDLVGRSLPELLRMPVLPQLKQTEQINIARQNRTQLPVELTIDSYSFAQNEKYLACLRDVSARVEIELAKRDFVSMISHDLRSPLMSLLGTLTMISAARADSVTEESDESARTELNRTNMNSHLDKSNFAKAEVIVEELVDFINDFLDLGKVEASPESLVRSEVRLQNLFTQMWEVAEKSSTLNHCEIELPELANNSIVQIDLDRMALALASLVEVTMCSNPGVATVWVKAKVSEVSPNNPANFAVRIGCAQNESPKSVKENCIEGYTLHYYKSQISSSGLLLALSRAIILAHGGTLAVIDTDQGDTFELVVPCRGTS